MTGGLGEKVEEGLVRKGDASSTSQSVHVKVRRIARRLKKMRREG
jgi:hypothetical protein